MEMIEVTRESRITTIRLNRPRVHNAINYEMHQELQAAFDEYAADHEQQICVVTGEGDRAFCAGSDLKDKGLVKGYPKNGYAGLIERFDLDKPVIAAVNGLALGGGFEVALACDVIIAAESATFGLPEPLVGAVALGGGLHRLARQIGLKQAMGMIMTAKSVSATKGLQMGFVNEVVAADQLSAAVDQWCQAILAASPMSLRASKQTVMRGLEETSLEEAIRNQKQYPAFDAWRSSADAIEGPKAFAEKRKPEWSA